MRARSVAFIPVEGFVEGRGYRVAFVTEYEPGFRWTGTLPYHGVPGTTAPWFWGTDYEKAQAAARDYNLTRLGINAAEAAEIIASSMRGAK